MRHTDRLPESRNGAGLLWNMNGTHVMPIRDNGPIAQPKRADGQMGMVEDELVKNAQAREGTEETAIIRYEDDRVELGVPSLIEGTPLEENLLDTYQTAREDDNSPLPAIDGTFTYDAAQETPDGMPQKEVDAGHVTAYTYEVTDSVSQELMNDLAIDIEPEEIKDGSMEVYDLEHMTTDDDDVIHFDRPVAMLDAEDDTITVYRSGQQDYHGPVDEFESFLEDEYDWEMTNVTAPATAKVQARLDAYGDQLGDTTEDVMVNQAYMQGLSAIGDAFDDMPAP